uniref:Uncharacterized protein n=1 Tax=Zosterops lateralis melanops TaxID=1220523 RepID=A0A8D2P6I3_ZOSLA
MRNPGKEKEKHNYGHVEILGKEDVAVDDDGQAGHPGQDPDGHAGDPGHEHGAADARLHRVHDGQVAVDAQARQQEHAGLAQTVAKRPLVLHGCVGCPEGQSYQETQVGQRQVEEKDSFFKHIQGCTLSLFP